jgi:hypothetical protein
MVDRSMDWHIEKSEKFGAQAVVDPRFDLKISIFIVLLNFQNSRSSSTSPVELSSVHLQVLTGR